MGVLEVRCTGLGGSGTGPYVNVYHVWTADGDEQVVASALSGPFGDFYTAWDGVMPSAITWTVPERVVNVTATPPAILTAPPVSVPGTQNGQIPPQASIVVSWQTASAGRAYRGRTYLGPLGLGALSADGQVNAPALALVQPAATALISDIQAISGTSQPPFLCVYHGVSQQVTEITAGVVRTRMYTQRRRN